MSKDIYQKDKTMARKKQENEIKIPEVLSFRKCAEIFDVEIVGVDIELKGQRMAKAHQNEKGEKVKDTNNIAAMEVAKVSAPDGIVEAHLTVRFDPLRLTPDACNNPEWYTKLPKKLAALVSKERLQAVGSYFAFNICNGSWLWRNRELSEKIGVLATARFSGEPDSTKVAGIGYGLDEMFKATDLRLYPVSPDEEPHAITSPAEVAHLGELIAEALTPISDGGKGKSLHLHVIAKLQMEQGQTFYPSQLFEPVPEMIGKSTIGRKFARTLGGDKPIITGEKAWNAIRRWDAWHNHPMFKDTIAAIEPKGGLLDAHIDLRTKSAHNTIYDYILRVWEDAEGFNDKEACYIIGMLIRGGVFAGDKKEKE